MSTIVDVYLHGSVHMTNPGLEELLADTLSQGVSRSLLGPRGPADFCDCVGRTRISLAYLAHFPIVVGPGHCFCEICSFIAHLSPDHWRG